MKTKLVTLKDVVLNVTFAGDESKPPILLLHGFPEFSEPMIEAFESLSREGYYLIAPDQRGYHLSSKPESVRDYTLENLSEDMAELIAVLELKEVIVLGHDWGGVVAWDLASKKPDLVRKLIIMSAPHPAAFKKVLLSQWKQMKKSSYILFFALPRIPELLLSRHDFSLMKTMIGQSKHPRVDLLVKAWRQPGALKSMLNWYRAFFVLKKSSETVSIAPPTLIIWGSRDPFLGIELARESLKHCRDGRLEVVEKADHWLHHKRQESVLKIINEFLP